MWPESASLAGEESPLFWSQLVHRDIEIPFVQEIREIVRSRRPDVLIAEWATQTWAQALKDLEDIPFIVTGWAVEPGYDFLDIDETGTNRARAELGLPPIASVQPTMWVSFTPPTWGALDGPPLPNTRRFRLPTAPSTDEVPGHTAGEPFVYATLGTVFYTMRRLLKTLIAAIDAGGWHGLVTVGRENDRVPLRLLLAGGRGAIRCSGRRVGCR